MSRIAAYCALVYLLAIPACFLRVQHTMGHAMAPQHTAPLAHHLEMYHTFTDSVGECLAFVAALVCVAYALQWVCVQPSRIYRRGYTLHRARDALLRHVHRLRRWGLLFLHAPPIVFV